MTTTTEYRDPLARCEVEPDHIVHPYFVEKARTALDDLSGQDVPHEALAIWAESVRNRATDRPDGVVVARDGTLLAETRNVKVKPAGMYAYYADGADLAAHGVNATMDRAVDVACADLASAAGQDVVHIKATMVTHGASRRAMESGWLLNKVQAAARRREEATEDLDRAEDEWRAAIIAALAGGATQESVARNAGVSRARVGQIEKESAR